MKLIQLRKLIREELTKQMEMSEIVSGRGTGMDLYIAYYRERYMDVADFGPIPIRANSEEEFEANAIRIASAKSPEISNLIKSAEQATDPLGKIHTRSFTIDHNLGFEWPGLAPFVGEEVYMCYMDNNNMALYMVGFPKGTDLEGIGNIGGFVLHYM